MRQLLAVLLIAHFLGNNFARSETPAWTGQIERLVRQLNDDEAARRNEAEQKLLKLAPTGNAELGDAFLAALPKPTDQMPPEVRVRLARIRKTIESNQAEQALSASKLTLTAEEMSFEKLLDEIHQQTGNRLSDYRQQFGQDAAPITITLELQDAPFWLALDTILDQAKLSPYPFSGEESLALVEQETNAAPRVDRATYAGPFRIEAVNLVAQRNLRRADQQSARLELEIAWEPRLRPIAISQFAGKLEITADDGSPVNLDGAQEVFSVEVQPGSHATELSIPFVSPPRSVAQLASFEGELSALVPGRVVEFRFNDLTAKEKVDQQLGGVKVTLNRVRKNQQLWEVHMRLRVESDEAGLESHRGWVFQNLTYLLNKQGEIIDHVGFETTMQSEQEIGLAYFFELPNDELGNYTWVYRTPAAIVRLPVKYELKDIPLP